MDINLNLSEKGEEKLKEKISEIIKVNIGATILPFKNNHQFGNTHEIIGFKNASESIMKLLKEKSSE